MPDPETNLERFARATADADVAVIEGVTTSGLRV
jgi:hypothetical protein